MNDLHLLTNSYCGAEGASKALTKALLGERESLKSLGMSIDNRIYFFNKRGKMILRVSVDPLELSQYE